MHSHLSYNIPCTKHEALYTPSLCLDTLQKQNISIYMSSSTPKHLAQSDNTRSDAPEQAPRVLSIGVGEVFETFIEVDTEHTSPNDSEEVSELGPLESSDEDDDDDYYDDDEDDYSEELVRVANELVFGKWDPEKHRGVDLSSPHPILPVIDTDKHYDVVDIDAGEGGFSSVCLARSHKDLAGLIGTRGTLTERGEAYRSQNRLNQSRSIVAIKSFKSGYLESLRCYLKYTEVNFILNMPYHPNLVQVYEMFIDNKSYKLHYSMEAMSCDLWELAHNRWKKGNPLSAGCIKSILAQILNGIRHIHDNGYFHRDLKPQNCLVMSVNDYYGISSTDSENDFVIKVSDYGSTAFEPPGQRDKHSFDVGTIWYNPPEVILCYKRYSKPIDIWAFGCIAYELTTSLPLFDERTRLELFDQICRLLGSPLKSANYSMEPCYPVYGFWDEAEHLADSMGVKLPDYDAIDISILIPKPELSTLCDIIRACLQWDPNRRGTASSISEMPYFKGTEADQQSTSLVSRL